MDVDTALSTLRQHPYLSSVTLFSALAAARTCGTAAKKAMLTSLSGLCDVYDAAWEALVRCHATTCRGLAQMAQNRREHKVVEPSPSAARLFNTQAEESSRRSPP
jgi:hypothetical protein